MTDSTDMGLSPAQAAAVVDPRPQVMVTAAAGSGKTRLLVAAVVRALVDEALPVERLVAVTFTRKAGAELAARVREALEGCGRADLACSLDAAAVGTIDSLCRRLVKDRALEVGVDPVCAVLEAEAAALLKTEAMARAWETTVRQADEARLDVLAARGVGFRKEVVDLYDRLRGLGSSQPQIDMPVGDDEQHARKTLESSVREALESGSTQPKQSATLIGDLETLNDCLEWLIGPAEAREGEGGMRASGSLFPSRRTRSMEEQFGQVRLALTEYRCVLAEALLRPLLDTVNVLLAEFHREYSSSKSERGLVDFADLELKAHELLAKEVGFGLEPSGVGCDTEATQGALLLVDEFQDTNELQCAILSGLGARRLLMVGDERQSIYRFRGADVDVFKKRQAALQGEAGCEPLGSLHRLDVNYRSSPEIVSFINQVFLHAGFFGDGCARLVADPERVSVGPRTLASHGAHAGGCAAQVTDQAAAVQLLVADRRPPGDAEAPLLSMRQAEAYALAGGVRRLIETEGWRQRDIVVLLPTQIEVEAYREALLSQGIDVYIVRGKGYYMQEEVTDVIGLLKLLVAPHDELALLSVLRSPLVGLSDDGLYLLGTERRRRRAMSLWEVVRGERVETLGHADQVALDDLVERLRQLRTRVGRPGLSRLIDDAVSVFGYDLCLLSAPEGRLRFANVRKLMRLADEFESARGPDLAAFLSVVRSMEQVSDNEGSAPTLGENEDVVRVMTIHQAKGLEFPVVALAGLGADAHRPQTSTFAIGADGRVGMFLKGFRRDTYEDHDPSWGPAVEIAEDEVRREREEDVRLLYVAMTRAQERLMLVGARPTRGTLDGSRIGRIVSALGMQNFPETGESVRLDSLSATAVGLENVALAPDSRPLPVAGSAVGRAEGAELEERAELLEFSAVVGAPERISFSALSAYGRCPRRFYLERVLGLATATGGAVGEDGSSAEALGVSLLDFDEAHAGRDVGILVHRLLERFVRSGRRPSEAEVREAALVEAAALGIVLGQTDHDRAARLTSAAWRSDLGDRLQSPSAEPETPFFFAIEGVVVTGIMDLLIREPDCWSIADYKTNALRGRTVGQAAEPYSLQCAMYGLAALKAGAPDVDLRLVFLEDPTEVVSYRYCPEDRQRLEEELVQAFSGLKAGAFPRTVGEECAWCTVAGVCGNMSADVVAG